jgi:hypothetical protein
LKKNKEYALTSSQLAAAEKMMGKPLNEFQKYLLAKAINEPIFDENQQLQFEFDRSMEEYQYHKSYVEPVMNGVIVNFEDHKQKKRN